MGTADDPCDGSNEPVGSTKYREFLDVADSFSGPQFSLVGVDFCLHCNVQTNPVAETY
jgi:hypothetical protein